MISVLNSIRAHLAAHHGPVGDRVRDAFVAVIEGNLLTSGTSLPSERDLAAQIGVSRSTLRQALADLTRIGLIQSRPGAGSFVSGRIPKALSRLSGFTEDMQARGLTPITRVIDRNVGPLPSLSAIRMGLPLGTQALTLSRLRLTGDAPMSYEEVTVPVTSVGPDYDGTGSLYQEMDNHSARPVRMMQSLEAAPATPEIADLLGLVHAAPVLKIAQIGYSADGTAVEDAVSWYRGDRYKYVGEILG